MMTIRGCAGKLPKHWASWVIVAIAFGSLGYISSPPKLGQRLRFQNDDGLVLPSTCVLTGEPATETHTLRGFKGGYILEKAEKVEVSLPFSQAGWVRYSEAYPLSLRFFKGGLNELFGLPLIGGPLILCLAPLYGFLAGILALFELFFGKRQLVVPRTLSIEKERIVAIEILGVNERFIEAFLAANGQVTLADYRANLKLQVNTKLVLLVITLLVLAALIVSARLQGGHQ